MKVMIFYFSGTGNSLYAAKKIAHHVGEELVSIAAAENKGEAYHEYTLRDNEIVGFVHPTYAWGPPKIVTQFIDRLRLHHYSDNYVFSIATCGGNIGNSMKVIKNSLGKKAIKLNSGFSIIMPNNYILMGDVDSNEVAAKKLTEAEETLNYINKAIDRRAMDEYKLTKGPVPWLLTGLLNPLFTKQAIDPTKFHVTDECTGCGICEMVCSRNNIVVDQMPEWGQRCVQCLACVHYCPMQAIQYGKGTEQKGRYTNPNIKINEIVSGR